MLLRGFMEHQSITDVSLTVLYTKHFHTGLCITGDTKTGGIELQLISMVTFGTLY